MKKEIHWERWTHPFGGGYEYVDEEDAPIQDEDEDITDDEERCPAVRPVIPTPAGLMPIQVYGNFASNFDLWMFHTNFSINQEVIDTVKRVPGVELLDVVTRYRARVGFGKCFKSVDVKMSIQTALGINLADATADAICEDNPQKLTLDLDTKQRVACLEEIAKNKYKQWAIYVIPNGHVVLIHSDNNNEYQKLYELVKQSQELAGGVIFHGV